MKGFILVAVVAVGACGKSAAPSASTPAASASSGAAAADGDGAAPMDAREQQAWAQATEGEAAELARLAALVGCDALEERAATADLRLTAIRAMAYCGDFVELPWLARVVAGGKDDEASAAIDSIVDSAARPRRSVDPEDAQELRAGCDDLLALARAADRPRDRRVGAIRALRMLGERGCVKRGDIPADLDAK